LASANIVKDVQVWTGDVSGRYYVRSAYDLIDKHNRGPQCQAFKYLWKAKAFPNVLTTAWRVLLGRVPTRVTLNRRGVVMQNTLCALCQTKEESCQHLFVECAHAQRVWNLCHRWIEILSVQHNEIMIHFESFYLAQSNNKHNQIWRGVWAAIVRCIWEQRNSIVFDQGVVDAEEIFHNAQLKSWLWLKHKEQTSARCFADWLMNPMLCISSCNERRMEVQN